MAFYQAQLQIDILHVETDELRDPHTGGVHHFQHGLVPVALVVHTDRLGQQELYLFAGEDLGQLFLPPLNMNVTADGGGLQKAL